MDSQALGLGPNGLGDTPATYELSSIRTHWAAGAYRDTLEEIAQARMCRVRHMVQANLDSLGGRHCETCTCPRMVPEGWSAEACENFLKIPIDRVWRAGGGW